MKRVTRSIVPNMLTLVNLFSGFMSLIYSSKGEFETAALLILIASIFDMLDGVMARLFRATSEFGAELDSICDVVSFGVAPSYMLYQVYFNGLGDIGYLLAAFPALAGAVRLARFNVKLSSFDDKLYFQGLPIPSSALTILSYLVFIHIPDNELNDYKDILIISMTVMTSLAMVSSIKFDNLPRPTKKSFMERKMISIMFWIGLIACIVSSGKMIFPFMMFYIIFSSIRSFVDWIRKSDSPEDDIDESEEAEASGFDI